MSPNPDLYDIHPETLRGIAQNRPGFWASLLLTAAIILGFGVVAGMGVFIWPDLPSGPPLIALKIGMAVAPGLLWMAFFFLLERRDRSIHRLHFLLWLITGVFYLVTVRPLLMQVFRLDDWLFMGWWADIVADLLIIAPLDLLLIYLILRYGVYPGETLRRLVDGPAFGVAAGLGLAAVLSLLTVWPESFLTPRDALAVSERALSYAAVGGWLGYGLARARFAHTQSYYLPGVFLLTVFLHGVFYALVRGANALTVIAPPYSGLLAAGLLAFLSFAVMARRMRQHHRAFVRMAARVEIQRERERPRSLLGDLMRMAEEQSPEERTAPPPPPPPSSGRDEDELASLKRNWEALIAEQEGKA